MKRKRLLLAVALVTGMLGWNSAQAQKDITSDYLTNADLSTVDNGWTYYSDAFKYTDWKTDGDVPVVEFYSQWNAGASVAITQKDFKFSQTITLPAGDYRIAVNAFYRNGAGDGTNDNKAWIFAGDKKQNVYALTSAGVASYTGSNDLYKAANAFSRGDFSNAFDFSLEEEQEIELGFQGFFNTSLSWCILGPVKLYKYSLEDYLVDYRAKVAEAEALYDSPMNGDVLSALQAAVVDESTFSLSSQVTDAIKTLTTTINNANASIAKYVAAQNTINETSAVIAKLDAAGQAAGNAELNTIQTAYNDRSLVEFTNAQANAIIVTAAKSQTTEGADMTLAIVNPSFENGFSSGWTNNGMSIQNNTSFEKDGNNYAEKWQPNGTFSVKQSMTLLSTGVYRLTAKTKARGVTSAKLFANGVDISITVGDVVNTTVVEFACDANSEFEFGFEGVGTGAGNSWLCVDDFHLTYVGDLPDVSAVEGKMNAEVATAQTNAISTYNGSKTVANYNAAVAAVAAAQASVDAYTSAAAAIADAKAIQENHNFATAEAVTTFAEAIAAIETPYNDNSLTTEVAAAAGTTLGVAISTWHANPNAAAVNYMENGFGLTDFETALYVNTWSDEGESDGSNFKVPFYEYYTGNENSLGENTWTGTLTGLENGLYKVSAWVRVQAKAEAEAADATGITMNVNGGEAKDVTEGDVVGQFQLATYEAEGLVKDGTLKVNFNIAADNNISWLSFKNVKYTKVRDLTEEEMAVVPTAIALSNGETVVTEAIELTATANTVTLTPVFIPENATETVTWTSSDETVATVADGVVTGIAPGTATITVTSTLDETVSATAEVTVSYPESTVPETVEIIDEEAMTKTIYTLSQTNLIKNGTFEYPNAVYGWQAGSDAGAYTAVADVANVTVNKNGGVNNGTYITTSGAGVKSAKTICKSIAVEPGKTYYFSVYTSGKAPSADNFKYNALFKMSDATTETGTLKEFEWPQGAGKTSSEWSQTESVFTAETGYVGVRMGWNESSNFDEFVLAEVISKEVIDLSATAEDYAALNEAIEEVPTLGFLAEEAAPYNNVEAAAALAAAQSIDQSVKNLATTVQAATTALNSVTWNTNTEEVNAIFDGSFETDYSGQTGNVQPIGWYRVKGTDNDGYNVRYMNNVNDNPGLNATSHKTALFAKLTALYGTAMGYTMPLKKGAYSLKFKYGGWNEQGTREIKIYSDDHEATILSPSTITAKDNQAHKKEDSWSNYDGKFIVPEDGDYIISFYRQSTSQNQIVISDIEIFSIPKSTIDKDVELAAGKYATRIYPFAPQPLDGITFYSCAAVEGTTLSLKEETELAANTPYILGNDATEAISIEQTGVDIHVNDTYTEGRLTGIFAPITLNVNDAETYYVLQTLNGKQAFYVVDGEFAINTLYRAYLSVPKNEATGVKAFNLGVDDATAINALDALTSGAYEGIYTVDGMKLNRIEKGVNILKMTDGTTRKVIVK